MDELYLIQGYDPLQKIAQLCHWWVRQWYSWVDEGWISLLPLELINMSWLFWAINHSGISAVKWWIVLYITQRMTPKKLSSLPRFFFLLEQHCRRSSAILGMDCFLTTRFIPCSSICEPTNFHLDQDLQRTSTYFTDSTDAGIFKDVQSGSRHCTTSDFFLAVTLPFSSISIIRDGNTNERVSLDQTPFPTPVRSPPLQLEQQLGPDPSVMFITEGKEVSSCLVFDWLSWLYVVWEPPNSYVHSPWHII